MTEKDKASPRQRQIMEDRWKKAREECPAGKCVAASRFHVAGCERRQQKIKITNLNTGEVVDGTIDHSDTRAVKDVLDQHEKKAVLLEPVGEEYWDAFERGEPGAREVKLPPFTVQEAAPARPWWKFWGRRAR